MSQGKKPNHEADIKNANRGMPGTNITWDKAQGNRGKQLNPNWKQPSGGKGGSKGQGGTGTKK